MKYRKTLLALGLALSMVLGTTASFASNFGDIDTHWSRFYVERLEEKGIVSGYEGYYGKYFDPDGNVTREEISTLLSKYMGGEGGQKSLKDIENRWSTSYIKYLLDKNIISGYPDGTFKPTREITRAEFAMMINKYLEQEGKISNNSKVKVYDIGGNWAEKAITNVMKSGYMNGYEDGTFKPENNITRGEVSTVIALIDGAFKTKDLSNDSDKLEEIDMFLTKAFGEKMLYPYKKLEIRKGEITDTDMLEILGRKTWVTNKEGFKNTTEDGICGSIILTKEEVDNYTLSVFGKTIDHTNTDLKINNEYRNLVARNIGDGNTELFILISNIEDLERISQKKILKQIDKDVYIADIIYTNNINQISIGYQVIIEKKDGKEVITEIIERFIY